MANFMHVITTRGFAGQCIPFTILDMPEQRSPARPWYDLVREKIAVRGWSVNELAKRAGIGRPTIYGWRDKPNAPWPDPVNKVADLLGVPRPAALRLAGIIADGGGAGRPPPVPPELEAHPDLVESVRRTPGLDDEDRARVLEAIARTLRGEPQPPTPGAEAPSPGGRERAG
jgi:transcriptional regulator with XRE-family HTH domain